MRLRAARGGSPRGGELNPQTRARILDGALQAIAYHGLSKLGMNDVSEHAGVSRGTLYRYFPGREELLQSLAAFESARFQQRVGEALRSAPPGAARLRIVLQHVARYVNEHPAIPRLIENEPAFVLRYLRQQFPALCAATGAVLTPLLGDTRPVRQKVATTAQLVDWLTRVMISAVLFPDPDPDGMARGLTAVYGLLVAPSARPPRPVPMRRVRRAMNGKERRR
jgi:TetR/AcrR family transcriptional regulator, repressor for uid operon